jgi:hypothetical protein
MTTLPEQYMGASNFKIKWTPTTKTTETLQWTILQSKFEIHVVVLEQVELNDILPHCLGVLHKIDGQVGLDSEDQQVIPSGLAKNHVHGTTSLLETSC